jgi:hypothetical protein
MATRPSDITELVEAMGGGCPVFKNRGYCFYGAMCRLGSCHVTKTGENVRNEEVVAKYQKENSNHADGKERDELTINSGNILSRDVIFQLRKKTYPFECKRYFEEREQKAKGQSDVSKIKDSGITTEDNTSPKSTAIDPFNVTEVKDTKDLNSPSIHAAGSTTTNSTNTSSSTPLDKLKTKKKSLTSQTRFT